MSRNNIVRLLVLLPLITVATILAYRIVHAATYYDQYVMVGAEGYNPLDMKLTGVYSQIKFAYNEEQNKFLLDYTNARNWRYEARWCITCYANILDTKTTLTDHELYDRAMWEMGSYNVHYTGYNEITIKTTETVDYLWVDYWVYIDGKGKFGPGGEISLLPIVIEFVLELR